MPKKTSDNAGTWFLSYLCEIGVIKNDDTVQHDYVTGTLQKDFWDIPKGHHVYITMNDGETLNIKYTSPEEFQNFEETDEDMDEAWFSQDFVQEKKVKINLTYTPC